MNSKTYVLRAAVAACFAFTGGQALAVLDLTVSPVTGILKYAKEIPSNTAALANPGNQHDMRIKVPVAYKVDASNPLFVKFDMTSGAKFTTGNPVLACLTAAGADSAVGTVTVGGAGFSNVTFTMPNTTTTVSGTCRLSANVAGTTISGLNAVNVSATVEYKNGLSNVVSAAGVSPFITFVRGVSATLVGADGDIVVDATSGSDNFTAASNKGTLLGLLGRMIFEPVGTSASVAATTTNIAVADVITTAVVTVNGPAVSVAMGANAGSGIFLDTDSACNSRDLTVSASASNSVTFYATPAQIAAALYPCINISGVTTQVPTGQFTGSIASGVAVANVTADFSVSSDRLENITQNGTTKNAYMVNASTSAAKTSIVRIINTGAAAAAFTATAFTVDVGVADGQPVARTQLGTANSALGTVAAGGSLTLSSAQIETALGFVPNAGGSKYRVVISAGTDAFKVLNFTRDISTGAIVLTQSQDD